MRGSRIAVSEGVIRIALLYPQDSRPAAVKSDTPFTPDAFRLENGNLMAGPGCTFGKGEK